MEIDLPCCRSDVSLVYFEILLYENRFKVLYQRVFTLIKVLRREQLQSFFFFGDTLWKQVGGYRGLFAKDNHSFGYIFKLGNISWPAVINKRFFYFRRYIFNALFISH